MIGNIAQFWRLTRELDINGLRETFERSVTIRVLGSELAAAQRLARLIEPDPSAGEVAVGVLAGAEPGRADLYVVAVGSTLDSDQRRHLSELSVGDVPLILVQSDAAADLLVVGIPEDRVLTLNPADGDDETRDRLFKVLVRAAPEVLLSAGRRHPLLREPVADHLIRDTSRVNAQFAAISSLPANIPLVGGLVGDMADVLVLTKNQVVLLFKLAGLYGRDLRLRRQLLLEILPVVGGAFFWRTTARAAVGLLPPILALVPKTLVAFTGTYTVGQMARFYFRSGDRPSPELIQELRNEGARLAREAFGRFRR